MEVNFDEWYKSISQRKSRRHFSSRPIDPALIEQLKAFCDHYRPFSRSRAVLVTESPDKVFKMLAGGYGLIKGAPAYLAFLGDKEFLHIQEQTGYTGEGVILQATSLGLGTCWVAGTYNSKIALEQSHALAKEKVLAVSPVGYPVENLSLTEKVVKGVARSQKRKPLKEIISGLSPDEWAPWQRSAVEAARLAPSASNRQPWKFQIEPESITVISTMVSRYVVSERLDCGIAMQHIEVGASYAGARGNWEFLASPPIARYRVGTTLD